jgi:hypothetical protein
MVHRIGYHIYHSDNHARELQQGYSHGLADAAYSQRCPIESHQSHRDELADAAHSVTTWRDLYPSSVTSRRCLLRLDCCRELADAACSVTVQCSLYPFLMLD